MKRRHVPLILVLGAVLVVSSLCWLMPLSRTSQAAPAPSGDAAFKGKVLLLSTSNMMSVFLLEKAQIQKLGDHSFLVGKGAADGGLGAWYKGRTVRLQMEHVVSITEFDDLQEAKKALESGGGASFSGPVHVGEAATPPVPAALPVPAAPLPPPPAKNP